VIATEESEIDAQCVAELTTDESATSLRQRVLRLARQSETVEERPIVPIPVAREAPRKTTLEETCLAVTRILPRASVTVLRTGRRLGINHV